MRLVAIVIVLGACGAKTPPAPIAAPESPPPPAAKPVCEIHPLVRADGLAELDGRPGEIANPPCDAGAFADVLDWVAAPGHLAVAPAGAPFERGDPPFASHDDPDGTRVLDVMSTTHDRRCTAPGEPGALLDIDLPEQATARWSTIAATDRPLRLAYHYWSGGCTFAEDGGHLTIQLGGADPRPRVAAVEGRANGDAEREQTVRYRVEGDLVVVEAPFDLDEGGCQGAGPLPNQPPPPPSRGPIGFPSPTIDVPATGARVVVRPIEFTPTAECS